MAEDVTAVPDIATTQTKLAARAVVIGMYVYRDDERRWVRAVSITTSNDTTRILTQGRADALEYAVDEHIDVCLPLQDGGA